MALDIRACEEDLSHLIMMTPILKRCTVVRHIAVTDGGHGDDGPPKAVRNGLEVAVRRSSLRKVNRTGKQNHA